MPRKKADPNENRGGERQGEPGKSYANRTDMNLDHAPEGMVNGELRTAAAGSITPPPVGEDGMYPDDTPMLGGPTRRPDEPVTAGLNTGGVPTDNPSEQDMQIVLAARPELKIGLNYADTPTSFKALMYYLDNL